MWPASLESGRYSEPSDGLGDPYVTEWETVGALTWGDQDLTPYALALVGLPLASVCNELLFFPGNSDAAHSLNPLRHVRQQLQRWGARLGP